MYPEYGIPTCDKNLEDDGGEFRCPLGKERKANGVSRLSFSPNLADKARNVLLSSSLHLLFDPPHPPAPLRPQAQP